MSNSSSLIESFLYQTEGTAIDFKREQYLFDKASDEQKSELLKDVLAFANSWRQGDAYIVIGVIEVDGGRHKTVNIVEHPDDAQIQQFINSKTNRNVQMAYEVHCYEGNKLGVIRIAKQERPFYVKKDFGKVKKDLVYYRLGSSTAVATPEDIARMGREVVPSALVPVMDLQFADHKTCKELGTDIKLKSVVFAQPLQPLPTKKDSKNRLGGYDLPVPIHEQVNPDFWQEQETFIRLKALFRPVVLIVQNQSSILAEQVRVEITGSHSGGIGVTDELPDKPADRLIDVRPRIRSLWQQQKSMVEVRSYGDQWSVNIRFGNVQPRASVWLDEPFYLGSKSLEHLELNALIFANNLPEPQKAKLLVEFTIEHKPALTVKGL